ncbi:MAG: FMN-binding protein, partial [bacterium]
LVGIDSSEKITNLVILSQQETPGLGTRIEEDSFISQFKGKTLSEAKLKRDGGKIDGITGATISSSAVANNIASISDSNIKQVEE